MGWSNAHVIVEGAKLGLGWAVIDDKGGSPMHYSALITIALPVGTQATVSKKAPNETVVINHSASIPSGPDGIQADVAYLVTRREGAGGEQVAVNVATVAGQKPAATGDVLGGGSGDVGQTISVHLVIPRSDH